MKRPLAAAALGSFALAGHFAPALACVPPLRNALLPRTAGQGDPGGVALTFDDGPDPVSTPRFLEELERLGWKATFFMLGAMVEASPGLAAEVLAAGHEIALHGYLHRSHLLRTWWGVRSDLATGKEALHQATGAVARWHRPPYGAMSGGTMLAAAELDLDIVLWTTWGRDWRAQADPSSVLEDLKTRLAPGATLLLHDSDCTSAAGAWRSALGALEPLAELLAEQGLEVRPLAAHRVGA